jgi:DNA-binding beta-propeller fold protein YncE
MSIDPNTNLLYIFGYNYTSKTGAVSIINGTTSEKVGETHVADVSSYNYKNLQPQLNPKTKMAYVAGENSITAINGTTHRVAGHIHLEHKPSEFSINENTNLIYVLTSDPIPTSKLAPDSIIVINGTTNKIINDFPITGIGSAEDIAVDPKTIVIYIVSKSSESISAINGTTNRVITH